MASTVQTFVGELNVKTEKQSDGGISKRFIVMYRTYFQLTCIYIYLCIVYTREIGDFVKRIIIIVWQIICWYRLSAYGEKLNFSEVKRANNMASYWQHSYFIDSFRSEFIENFKNSEGGSYRRAQQILEVNDDNL